MATAAISAAPAVAAAPPGLPSLRDEAAARGLRYGAHPYNFPPPRRPGLDALAAEQCGLIAPVLAWPLAEPSPGAAEAEPDRGVAALAAAHGIPLTGYHLLWFEAVPRWLLDASPSGSAVAAAIERHIRAMGRRYGPATFSVNVVNEAIAPEDGRPDGLRADPFLRALGPDYWDDAFRAAREAFPGALLACNEYGTEQQGPGMRARRKRLLDKLDRMLARGVPVDGVGLQSHLALSTPFDAASFRAFLREVAARGVRIVLSELDVSDIGAPTSIERRDRAVAGLYGRFLDAALDEPAVAAVVTWGLTDGQSWITAGENKRFDRPDGLPQRPLLFDEALSPKPAFHAVAAAFRAAPARAPWTPPAVATQRSN